MSTFLLAIKRTDFTSTSSLKKYFIYLPVRAQTSLRSVRFSIAGAPPPRNGVCVYTEGLVFIYFLAQTKPVLRIDAKSKYLSCRILAHSKL